MTHTESQLRLAEGLFPPQLVKVAIVSPLPERIISKNAGDPEFDGSGFRVDTIVYDSDITTRVTGKYDLVVLVVRKPALPEFQALRIAEQFKGSSTKTLIIPNPEDVAGAISTIKDTARKVLVTKKTERYQLSQSQTD